jgi:hypothetical protein
LLIGALLVQTRGDNVAHALAVQIRRGHEELLGSPFSPYSVRACQRLGMRLFLLFAMVFGLVGVVRAQGAAGPMQDCFQPREMQEILAAQTLVAPAAAVMTARRQVPNADVVRANLCRSDNTLVYVIVALRKDGRVVHVMIDGASGRVRSVQ